MRKWRKRWIGEEKCGRMDGKDGCLLIWEEWMRKIDASWFEKNVEEENLRKERERQIFRSKGPPLADLSEERTGNDLKHH